MQRGRTGGTGDTQEHEEQTALSREKIIVARILERLITGWTAVVVPPTVVRRRRRRQSLAVVACVPVAAGTRQAVVARTVTSAADGAAHDEGSLVVQAARVILRPPAGAASAVRARRAQARRAQAERRQGGRGSPVRNVRNVVASWPYHPVGQLVRLVQQEAAATQLVHRLAVALRLHALVLAVVVWQVRAGDRVRLRAASRQLRAPRCSVRAQHRELDLFAPVAVGVRAVAVIAGTSTATAARGVGVARAACLELAVQHLVVISAVLAVNSGGGQEFFVASGLVFGEHEEATAAGPWDGSGGWDGGGGAPQRD